LGQLSNSIFGGKGRVVVVVEVVVVEVEVVVVVVEVVVVEVEVVVEFSFEIFSLICTDSGSFELTSVPKFSSGPLYKLSAFGEIQNEKNINKIK
tara:strand:+ start:133 stop:414 length:282 start_codon:yes stop_codon:yes gene_type:complete